MYKATAFIGGKEVSSDEREVKVYSPINGEVVGTFPDLTEEEVDLAFSKAHEAYIKWSQLDYKTRIKYLLAFAAKLKEHAVVLAQIVNLETGKDLVSANDEIQRSYEYIIDSSHAYADMNEKPEEYNYDNNILVPKNIHATYVRVPLGIALTISPFNYPVNLLITKIVPAILTGNAVVHKSATNGSLSGWYIAKIFHDVTVDGFLMTPGIFNYLTGRGSNIGKWFNKNKNIQAFSFTGSSYIGKQIVEQLPSCISLQLELGGHNPAIVLDDADLDLAVSEIIKGAFGFSGQRCTSIKRVLVNKKVHDSFIEKLKEKLSFVNLKEPLISSGIVNELKESYEDAISKGATRVGGELIVKGNYVTPVVFTGVKQGMKLYEEEVFAPVLAISSYEKEDEILGFCNESKYGLQASIFGKNIDLITKIALKLEFNRVNINVAPSRSPDVLPFGGVKDSGFGLQSINESLRFFTCYRGIVIKQNE